MSEDDDDANGMLCSLRQVRRIKMFRTISRRGRKADQPRPSSVPESATAGADDALSGLRQRAASALLGAKGGSLTHSSRQDAGSPAENPVARLKLLLVSALFTNL